MFKHRLALIGLSLIMGLILLLVTVAPAERARAKEAIGKTSAAPAVAETVAETVTVTVPVGFNFQISDADHSYEFAGKPVIDFDGANFMMIFDDHSNNNIFGLRISPAGVVLDDPPIAISDATSHGINAAGRFDGTNYLVVWESGYEIYGARVTPAGVVLDPGGVKLTTGSSAMDHRMLGLDFDGANYLVVWRTTGAAVRGMRVNASGGNLVNLSDPSGFPISDFSAWARYPAVAYGGGVFLVAWHSGNCGSNQAIHGARVDPDGTVLNPADILINDGDGCQEQAIAAWDGANFLVAWNNWTPALGKKYASVSAARVMTDGTVLDSPAIPVADHGRGEKPFSLACDGTYCLIVWDVEHDAPLNFRLTDAYGKRIDRDGNVVDVQGIPISAAAGHQFSPMVGYGDGVYMVVWKDMRTTGQGVIWGQILENQVVETSRLPDPQANPTPGRSPSVGVWTEETYSANSDEQATSGVALAADNSYAFGRDIYRYQGTTWAQVTSDRFSHYYGAWASGADDIWLGATSRVLRYWDGDVWTAKYGIVLDAGTAPRYATGIYSIWGLNPEDIWAAIDQGYVLKFRDFTYDPSLTWEYIKTPTDHDLWDIWGTAADDIYAVGDRGTIVHYNGSDWTLVPDIPTLQSLNAIWGDSPADIWAAGDWGALLHYDGSTWEAHLSGVSEHFTALWGRDSSDIYAVGLGGTVLHYDGVDWSAEDAGSETDFLSVWGVVDQNAGSETIWIGTRSNKVMVKSHKAATFLASPTAGLFSVTTAFTNTSAAGYTTFQWDFGDGVTSTMESPTHTYNTIGVYTVTLDVVWPDLADTDTKRGLIHVYQFEPVQASFIASPTWGLDPYTVWFTSTTTGAYDSLLWDFGDQVTGTLEVISHTYDDGGCGGYYTVTLTASGPGGVDSVTKRNLITNQYPTGAWYETNPNQGFEPLAVTFNGGCSGENDFGTLDFGDGSDIHYNYEQETIGHVYEPYGKYTATLTCPGPWNTAIWQQTFTVWDTVPPTATLFAAPISGTAPLTVAFSGACEGDTHLVYMHYNDGTGFDDFIPSTHVYQEDGVYTPTLVCWAQAGETSASQRITVTLPDPPAAILTADPISGTAPLTVSFSGGCTGETESVQMNYDDGSDIEPSVAPTHVYQDAGVYTPTLTCSAPAGESTASQRITVNLPAAPVATFDAAPMEGFAPLTVTITGGCSGSYHTETWDFGELFKGQLVRYEPAGATLAGMEHVYQYPGRYTIRLTCEGLGGLDWMEQDIWVWRGRIFLPLLLSNSAILSMAESQHIASQIGPDRAVFAVLEVALGGKRLAMSPLKKGPIHAQHVRFTGEYRGHGPCIRRHPGGGTTFFQESLAIVSY